ncbi:MAG: hypothetical protein B7Z37_11180 [Verrucomicrobia bacterium 12-59-8]|nr:MAG: hypothetical protein B7Z37_11180 [Verrucomicrobia bacterium 12-59-8]
MNRYLIITDYTRFKPKNPNVCIAGIDYNTGECIRPYPYLSFQEALRLGIAPGAILHGNFDLQPNRSGPHQEDSSFADLQLYGVSTASTFRDVLLRRAFDDVRPAFGLSAHHTGRGVPVGHQLAHSIASVRVLPSSVAVVEDGFTAGKIRLNFTDLLGESWTGFPITDLGFYDYAQQHQTRGALDVINNWMQSQSEVMLRIGLSRAFQPSGQPNAYWMQANGIYTFPEAPPGIRKHA